MLFILGNSIAQVVVITTFLFVSSIEGKDRPLISTPFSEEKFGLQIEEVVESSSKESSLLISTQSLDTWMVEMLDLVNKERSLVGESPLCYNQKIIDAAYNHNQDMKNQNYFSHIGKDGSTPGDRITRENYTWSSYGENIAKGQGSVQAVMNAWMNSPGHKANIISGNNKHFGAAWETNGNYWTQVFANTWVTTEVCVSLNTPTQNPTTLPSASPTIIATANPTVIESSSPTTLPSASPTIIVTANPSVIKLSSPTTLPSASPTIIATANPSVIKLSSPTTSPSASPTIIVSASPSNSPSITCKDTKKKFKLKIGNKRKKQFSCKRLAKIKKKKKKKKNCNRKTTDGSRAHKKCPLTCGKC